MIHLVSEIKGWSKGTQKIGDTLFIDGTPYISCGVCDAPIRKVDAFQGRKHTKVENGRKIGIIESYQVMVGYWIHEDEIVVDRDGQSIYRRKSKPILRSVPSCFNCWQRLNDMKAAKNAKMNDGRNDHLVFYPSKDIPKPPKKALISTASNSYKFTDKITPIADKVSKTHNTYQALMGTLLNDYIPIITWHPPLINVDASYDMVEKAFETVGHLGNNLLGISNTGKLRLRLVC